jgi:hypothetical protein
MQREVPEAVVRRLADVIKSASAEQTAKGLIHLSRSGRGQPVFADPSERHAAIAHNPDIKAPIGK